MKHPIYWLFGNTGAGKTTLGKKLAQRFGAFLIDGDVFQQETGCYDMSEAGRRDRCLMAARRADHLSPLRPVVVSMITPYEDLRVGIQELTDAVFIYLPYGAPASAKNPFEEPLLEHVIYQRKKATQE
jgi:adenylylsulfate kinase-like enzyme